MKLQILCNGVGTHADVSTLHDHEQAVVGAQVLLPGETYRGMDYEAWSRHSGRTVDLLQLQARLWTRPKSVEPPPPSGPVVINERRLEAMSIWNRPVTEVTWATIGVLVGVILFGIGVWELPAGWHTPGITKVVLGGLYIAWGMHRWRIRGSAQG